ncbi:MAG: DUF2637 domain-containing protein [Anaerolineae bacterium]|nr:DUF2637 domain-containing protein [Anaerolineae bacterium]
MNTKTIAWITGSLTLLMALFSFVLSFNALTDLAAQHGVSIPPLFPLVVEAGVVIFSLNALYRSVNGESVRWQWALIIGSSLIAGSFNVAHAQTDILSRAMAAMPSLFLLLSFETFIGQIKHVVKRSNTVESIEQLTEELNTKRLELDELIKAKQSALNQLNSEADRVNSSIEQAQETLNSLREEIEQAKRVQNSSIAQAQQVKAQQDALTIEQRRGKLLHILTLECDIGPTALADRLNTSRGTVYSDLKALSETGQVVKNGDGWEVVQ